MALMRLRLYLRLKILSDLNEMIEKIISKIILLFAAIAAAAILLMVAATMWDVTARSLFNRPLHGVIEFVELCFFTSVMEGLPLVFIDDAHIRVDVIDKFLTSKKLQILKKIGFISTSSFTGMVLIFSVKPIADAYRFGDIKYELGVNLYFFYGLGWIALMICFICTFLGFIKLNKSEDQ